MTTTLLHNFCECVRKSSECCESKIIYSDKIAILWWKRDIFPPHSPGWFCWAPRSFSFITRKWGDWGVLCERPGISDLVDSARESQYCSCESWASVDFGSINLRLDETLYSASGLLPINALIMTRHSWFVCQSMSTAYSIYPIELGDGILTIQLNTFVWVVGSNWYLR